jgi:8-oxo-dGTP pyrophosphatase MutT (NUDIX family)
MEYWDIYDANKQLTGRTMMRNDWNMQPGDYHLTVLGVIRIPDGRFLITQRVKTKSWAPGWWEVSGGGVMAGETSEEAIRREIREETGLDVSCADGGYQFTYRRDNPEEKDNYFVDVYRFDMDITEADVHIQKSEAEGFRFADLEEIRSLAEQGIFLHYNSIKEVFSNV